MSYLKLPPTKYSNIKSNINNEHRLLLNSNKFSNKNLSKNCKYIPNKIINITIREMKQMLLQPNENTCNHNKNHTIKKKLKKGYFNNAVAIRKEILNKKNKRKRKLQRKKATTPARKRRKFTIKSHNENNIYLMNDKNSNI